MLLHSETNRPSTDSTTILCEWCLTAVIGDTTGVHKSTVSLAVRNMPHGCHIENNHNAYSREIALWDTNCRLARQYNYRLTHSASELSGFTGTSSLTMNEKFQYRTRPHIFIIQIEYTANKNRRTLSQPKPWCNDSGV